MVFVRNIITTALVFALTPWMDGMGVKWMFILLGILAVVFALMAVPYIIWGKRWRAKSAARFDYYRLRHG